MSYTEIYKFNKNGDAEMIGEIKNAWRGAMAVWGIIEKRYLPKVPKPSWMDQNDYNERGYSRCSMPPMGKENPMKPIWDLFNDDKVSGFDKIALGSTFDNVIVKKDHIPELIKAFRNFDGETSLKDQSDFLEKAFRNDKDLIAIAWNQTSVNCGVWESVENVM